MKRGISVIGVALFLSAAACSSSAEDANGPGATPASPTGESAAPLAAPGALVDVSMDSTVGVLLDEIPADMRDRVAAALVAKPASFWVNRAQRQIALTTYRLVFREYYYKTRSARKALPLPPADQRQVALSGVAKRVRSGKHDTVQIDYSFKGTLLTDEASPGFSEANLGTVGGVWDEPFTLPVDPEMVFQRTRFACMDESEFPPNSVDSEEVDSFYDSTCTDEKTLSRFGQCHQTERPYRSCKQAVEDSIGRVDTKVHFTRLPWDKAAADRVRLWNTADHKPPAAQGANMQVVESEFRENRITYRYIEPNACELQEKCVTGTGWRRLLQFTTTDENIGTRTLDIGAVDYYLSGGAQTLNDKYHIFEYSSCHQHYHFAHYGTFSLGNDDATTAKRGFCLQATDRFSNHELSPLHNPYGGCDYQGVDVGWVDQYKAGLPCQWVDITDIDTSAGPVTKPLTFASNPDGFLCEGNPVLDAQGNPVFEPTAFKTATGDTVYRPSCNYVTNWAADNTHSYDVTLTKPGEGLITTACTRGQIGPLKNCGFKKTDAKVACAAGQTATMHCTVADGAAAQVVRVCERSETLGTGIPCKYEDGLATSVVPAGGADVTFKCPAARGPGEPGGSVSLYTSTVAEGDAAAVVTCTAL